MRRVILISVGVAISVTMMGTVFLRQNRVATLRTERARVLARLGGPVEVSPIIAPVSPLDFKQNSRSPSITLLQLRAEVTRLGNRKHELANVRAESERLQGQLATRGTNAPGTVPLGAGYIRKSEARNVGYATPENTIQSFLWAIQNRDASSLLQAFDPEIAKQLRERIQNSAVTEEFFKEFEVLPGLRILGREAAENGVEVLTFETLPGTESPTQLRFKQFEGQWKLVGGL